MRRAWAAWVELWDRREPATAQALVRIAVGTCILYDLLTIRRLGLIEALWAPPPDGMGGTHGGQWAVDWLGASAGTARLLWWCATVSIAAVVAGLGTRLAALTYVLVSAQLAYLAPDSERGIDLALRLVVLILAASSCHARWSIDALIRRRLGRPFPALVPAWPRLLLTAQTIWIYFSSGINKTMPEWTPVGGFEALSNVLSDPHYARFGSDWVASTFPLPQLATASVMVFELIAPALVVWAWFEATAERPGRLRRVCNRLHLRRAWIGFGVVLHLGIAATMRLGIFPWGMLALYPVLLIPDELVAAEQWLRGRVRRGRPAATTKP